MKWPVRVLTGLLALILAACAQHPVPAPPTPTLPALPAVTLRWVYPETYSPLVSALAQAYQQTHPQQRLLLLPQADSIAWTTLDHGEADIALLLSVPEDADWWTQTLAWDGLAIIVHPFNGIPGLTLKDVQQLFTGQVVRWTSLSGPEGAPQVVSREPASGEAHALQHLALEDNRVTMTALLAPSTELMLEFVGQDPLAVGYVMQSRLTSGVRTVSVEGIPPSPEAIAGGAYPLRVPLLLAAPTAPQTGPLGDFVAWMTGPEARALLTAQGLIVP